MDEIPKKILDNLENALEWMKGLDLEEFSRDIDEEIKNVWD